MTASVIECLLSPGGSVCADAVLESRLGERRNVIRIGWIGSKIVELEWILGEVVECHAVIRRVGEFQLAFPQHHRRMRHRGLEQHRAANRVYPCRATHNRDP